MKQLKFAIAGLGLLGAIGVFLPLVSAMGMSVSLWDARSAAAADVYVPLIGFLIGCGAGFAGIVKGPMNRVFGGIAVAGFVLTVIKLRELFEHFGDAAYGGKLMLACSAIGLIVAIVATVKPEDEA